MVVVAARVESLAQSNLNAIPSEYIRPVEEREDMGDALEVVKAQTKEGTLQIPLVDLHAFNSGNKEMKQYCVESVRKAAAEWGVMHITGHGISAELMQKVQEAGKKFFGLPIAQKEKYANDQASGNVQGYGSKLANSSDGTLEWQDYFFHLIHPAEKADFTIWPKEPADYM
jgi:anthocyanidin synthase